MGGDYERGDERCSSILARRHMPGKKPGEHRLVMCQVAKNALLPSSIGIQPGVSTPGLADQNVTLSREAAQASCVPSGLIRSCIVERLSAVETAGCIPVPLRGIDNFCLPKFPGQPKK